MFGKLGKTGKATSQIRLVGTFINKVKRPSNIEKVKRRTIQVKVHFQSNNNLII